jgi:hypothetical protein
MRASDGTLNESKERYSTAALTRAKPRKTRAATRHSTEETPRPRCFRNRIPPTIRGRRIWANMRLVDRVSGILFREALAAEGAVVFAKTCELGLEGIVSKREGSFYRCARSRNWLKARNSRPAGAPARRRSPPGPGGAPRRLKPVQQTEPAPSNLTRSSAPCRSPPRPGLAKGTRGLAAI